MLVSKQNFMFVQGIFECGTFESLRALGFGKIKFYHFQMFSNICIYFVLKILENVQRWNFIPSAVHEEILLCDFKAKVIEKIKKNVNKQNGIVLKDNAESKITSLDSRVSARDKTHSWSILNPFLIEIIKKRNLFLSFAIVYFECLLTAPNLANFFLFIFNGSPAVKSSIECVRVLRIGNQNENKISSKQFKSTSIDVDWIHIFFLGYHFGLDFL